MDYTILNAVCEVGISKDGKLLVGENGLLRYQMIDWEKSNEPVRKYLLDEIFAIPDWLKHKLGVE